MVMKWFTPKWHGYGPGVEPIGPARQRKVVDAYAKHLATIKPTLPKALSRLSQVNIHDAKLESWELNEGEELRLTLDLCFPPSQVTFLYQGYIKILGPPVDQLAHWLDNPKTVFLYDEIDLARPGIFEHRYLLWPEGEFGIRFREFEIKGELYTDTGATMH